MNINTNIYVYIVITDIKENHLITRQYGGYTKSQAIKLFKQEFNNNK